MTICLPSSLKQFSQDFDAVCERIRQTKQDPNFYDLLTALVANFQQNPLFKEFIEELNAQSNNNRKGYNLYCLERCEEAWLYLWKHPCAGWKQHKTLVCIKSIVFAPENHPLPLHIQLMTQMQKLAASLNLPLPNPFYQPGLKDLYKQEQMQRLAVLDASFCLDRLLFLRQMGDLKSDLPEMQYPRGKWAHIRLHVWDASAAICERNLHLIAQRSLVSKFALPPQPSLDPMLPIEYQIHRADYEEYFRSWQNHVHTKLMGIEAKLSQDTGKSKLVETQRESFAIEITELYWKENPTDNYDQVYDYYVLECPKDFRGKKKVLSRTQWERIVRKHRLDPRPKKEKVRGKGK